MTVRELITKLQTMDQDLKVIVTDSCYGHEEVAMVEVTDVWYYPADETGQKRTTVAKLRV